jgi:hypothetical protein
MTNKTPEEICESLLGQTIEGVRIDGDSSKVILTLKKGYVEFEGEGLEMYVEINELDS